MPSAPSKSSDRLYLEKLEFKPELRKTWLNFFVSNFRVVILLIILISAWGIYAFLNLPRESDPEVKIPIAVVSTIYAGVGPLDMEELVTKKIETRVAGLKGIKKISSKSMNSISSITVEFDAKENLDDSIRKLRDEVNAVKKDLPTDAKEPIVNEISVDDEPIWTIALTGPYDGFTLRKYAENLQDELEKIPGVREVAISGGDEVEFEVAYDPQKLTLYNLSLEQINQSIKAVNLAIPAGTFKSQEFVYSVRADARFFDAQKLQNLPILHTPEGSFVLLKDIATVQEKAIERTRFSRFALEGNQPQEAVTLSIIKKTGGNVLQTVDQAKTTLDQMIKTFPKAMSYATVIDYSKIIRDDFNQLTHDFFLTILLVGLILFLIVGLKEAFVAGLAIPLVFFVAFGVMSTMGISLNFLSMFSLLLSLGLLVDDAIVVVSATKQYLRTGKFTPEEAVLLVLNDFKMVLTTTTLTTVWAFLPLLSASGIMGEYLKSIPITVSVTLTASLLIALMINHPLAAVLERIRLTPKFFGGIMLGLLTLIFFVLNRSITIFSLAASLALLILLFFLARWYWRNGRKELQNNARLMEREWDDPDLIKQKLRRHSSNNDSLFSRLIHGILNFNAILPWYERVLRKLIATRLSRFITLTVTLLLFLSAIALPLSGVVVTEFFPPSDFDYIFINVRASTGLRLEKTDQIVQKIEQRLIKYPEIKNFSTIIGSSTAGTSLTGGASSSANLASLTVNLIDKKTRQLPSYAFADKIRADLKDIQEATITVESPSGGPPSGSAFEARIQGDDLTQLEKIALDLQKILAQIKGVINLDISLKEAPAEYTFTLNPIRLEFYNLNAAYVGGILRTAITGTEITTVIREGKEIKVMARFAKDKIPTLEAIQNLQIVNLGKQPVFLKDVAKIELTPSVEAISRIDQKRVVLLSAGVASDTIPNAVLQEFQTRLQKEYKMPEGYTIVYGGENEQNTESVLSILRAMVIAGILIISTLIIQFNSFKKAIIVLVTIPLALIGMFYGMALTGITLSFPGLIGMLALFGIVVKNAIILMDKINLNLKSGIPFMEAIVDAGKSRLEAIFITSVCTIVGLIPVTLSRETWTALGSAVIFGLALSSFFTLFIIPTLFRSFIGEKERF